MADRLSGSPKDDRSDWRGWTGHGPNPKHSDARRRSWDTRRERYGAHGGNRRRRPFHVKPPKDAGASTAKTLNLLVEER